MNDTNDPRTDNSTAYEIAKPTIKDIPQILKLWKEQYDYHHKLDPIYYVPYSEELGEKVRIYLERIIQGDDQHILVARDGANLVGFITFDIGETSYFDANITKYGELKEVLVTESARGTGIGGELVKTMEKHFQDLDLPYVIIQCSSFNKTALAIYQKMGYTPRQELLYKSL